MEKFIPLAGCIYPRTPRGNGLQIFRGRIAFYLFFHFVNVIPISKTWPKNLPLEMHFGSGFNTMRFPAALVSQELHQSKWLVFKILTIPSIRSIQTQAAGKMFEHVVTPCLLPFALCFFFFYFHFFLFSLKRPLLILFLLCENIKRIFPPRGVYANLLLVIFAFIR